MSRPRGGPLRLLLLVGAVGLAVRLAFTFAVAPEPPAVSDAGTYHGLANNLAAGRGYIRPYDYAFDGVEVRTAEFPPLFPAVLAAASFAGADSWDAHRVVACVLGASTVVLTGLLGWRVGGRRVGVAAASLAALWPMLFQSDAIPMVETLFTPLVVAALVCALDRRWALLGVLVGLAALTRSEGYLLVALLVVPALWRRWRELAGAVGLTLLVVSPWVVRNLVVFGELQPAGYNSATALAGANCERTYEGPMIGAWLLECVRAADVSSPTSDDEPERARARRDAALDFARDHPGEVPRVSLVRLARTWGVYHRLRQQVHLESLEGRDFDWHLAATRAAWPVLALAAAGAAVVLTRRRDAWPLLVPVVMASLATLATYGNQRFRQAAEPALLVLAVLAVSAFWSPLRSHHDPSGDRNGGAGPLPSSTG